MYSENELARIVVNICFEIHLKLGPGLFESVYEAILCHELSEKGIFVERQKVLPVLWKDSKLDLGFKTDIIIENKLILELKSIEELTPVHYKQLLTYLKLTNMKLGLLINFNEELMRDGIHRVVNGLQ